MRVALFFFFLASPRLHLITKKQQTKKENKEKVKKEKKKQKKKLNICGQANVHACVCI